MKFLDYFRSTGKQNSAARAKERLQVIIAHGRMERSGPDYFPRLRQELLEVIKKYTKVSDEDVTVTIEKEGNYEILEMNVTIPQK